MISEYWYDPEYWLREIVEDTSEADESEDTDYAF